MSTNFFDSSGGNPPVFIGSPNTTPATPRNDSFFNNSQNNSDPFIVRQNAFNNFRITSFSLFFHWFFIILHLTFINASAVVLQATWTQTKANAQALRLFISVMMLTSAARIYRAIYDRRWPLVTVTEWGTEVVRDVNTMPGHLAMFIHKNIDLICFLSSVLIMLIMDKNSSEKAEETIPLLFWTAMSWALMYFLYFLAPAFFLLGLIACLPCLIVVLQRMFNVSILNPGESSRAAPATQALLEKVWRVRFTADESFKYVNPEKPEQVISLEKEDTKCSICLGWYEDGDELRILPCSHHFHLGCADEWFKITATCPLCVRPIKPENQSPQPETTEIPLDPSNNPDSNV